jgi:hypothetical protein
MVNTHNQYQSSGKTLFPSLQRNRGPSMPGSPHEEHDNEDLKVIFVRLGRALLH